MWTRSIKDGACGLDRDFIHVLGQVFLKRFLLTTRSQSTLQFAIRDGLTSNAVHSTPDVDDSAAIGNSFPRVHSRRHRVHWNATEIVGDQLLQTCGISLLGFVESIDRFSHLDEIIAKSNFLAVLRPTP